MMVVIGIDPGFAHTGFGVVRASGSRLEAVDGGVIESPPNLPAEQRLARIHGSVAELISVHRPKAVALEQLYFGKNVRSAIGVGQARGVVMLAAAEHGTGCFDYTPQAVKLAVCGSGAADKRQVQRMVATLLRLGGPPRSDHAADALAVAICHAAHARPRAGRMPVAATSGSGAHRAPLPAGSP
jgi:crossover junction endodeoxyribonuclease RuvC